jgi:hypothetical protein
MCERPVGWIRRVAVFYRKRSAGVAAAQGRREPDADGLYARPRRERIDDLTIDRSL